MGKKFEFSIEIGPPLRIAGGWGKKEKEELVKEEHTKGFVCGAYNSANDSVNNASYQSYKSQDQ